jgi:hypothetical protein
MVEILLDDFLVLKDLFNCRNIPLTGFELPNVLWKEINTAQHFTLAAAIAQPPPRQFPAVPRQSRHFLRAPERGGRCRTHCGAGPPLRGRSASEGDDAIARHPAHRPSS